MAFEKSPFSAVAEIAESEESAALTSAGQHAAPFTVIAVTATEIAGV